MIDRAHPLPITRQARLLGLARSSVYYEPVETSERDLALMAAIDGSTPSCPSTAPGGSGASWIAAASGSGAASVTTLMRRMGITAIAPKRRLSRPAPGHKIYPYLLRGIEHPEAGRSGPPTSRICR